MRVPPVRYARIGDTHLGYQLIGEEGTHGVVALTTWAASIDGVWEHPSHLRIWRSAAQAGRVLQLDHRGIGVSDPVPRERLALLDEWAEDVVVAMDDAGMESVGMMAEREQAAVAATVAVRNPGRVQRLALVSPVAWPTQPPEATEAVAAAVEALWGTGQIVSRAADFADDPDFAARFERRAASPGTAAAVMARSATWDVRDLLPRLDLPTLVLHMHQGDADVEHSRAVAEAIPGADFVEKRPTSNWWGDGTFEAVVEFLLGEAWDVGERDLAALVFTDIVGSTERVAAEGDRSWRRTLDFLDEVVHDRARRHRGRVVKQTGDGHLLEFNRPADALAAAVAIRNGARGLELEVRAGVHMGEIERRDGGDIGGLAVHVAARVAAVASPGEVLVSRTVADLIAGHGIRLDDRGDHDLKGVDGTWRLFAAG